MPTLYILEATAEGAVRQQQCEQLPSSVELAALIGVASGHVEHVTVLYQGKRAHLFVDDEGALKGATPNKRASALYANATRSRGGERPELLYRDILKEPQPRDFLRDEKGQIAVISGTALFWPASAPDWEPEGSPWREYVDETPAVPAGGMPLNTPWGPPQDSVEVATGIVWCTTASHGGFWLSDARLEELPKWARRFSGKPGISRNWFEEDCDWCIVQLAFPAEFADHDPQGAARHAPAAEDALRQWHPDLWEARHGKVLEPGQSLRRDRDVKERGQRAAQEQRLADNLALEKLYERKPQ